MRKNATRNAVIRRHLRLRKKISGTAACTLLNVFRSLGNIYAQVIDDEAGVTLVSANTLDKEIKAEFPYGGNVDAAKAVGVLVGKRALEKGIECQLSLEERMACGIGACLACVCQSKEKDAHSNVKNKRICKEGPVFRAEEVEF